MEYLILLTGYVQLVGNLCSKEAGLSMTLLQLKNLLLLAGILLIAWGYHLLSVPPDADYELMLRHAKGGMLSTVNGGTILMTRLVKH